MTRWRELWRNCGRAGWRERRTWRKIGGYFRNLAGEWFLAGIYQFHRMRREDRRNFNRSEHRARHRRWHHHIHFSISKPPIPFSASARKDSIARQVLAQAGLRRTSRSFPAKFSRHDSIRGEKITCSCVTAPSPASIPPTSDLWREISIRCHLEGVSL